MFQNALVLFATQRTLTHERVTLPVASQPLSEPVSRFPQATGDVPPDVMPSPNRLSRQRPQLLVPETVLCSWECVQPGPNTVNREALFEKYCPRISRASRSGRAPRQSPGPLATDRLF